MTIMSENFENLRNCFRKSNALSGAHRDRKGFLVALKEMLILGNYNCVVVPDSSWTVFLPRDYSEEVKEWISLTM